MRTHMESCSNWKSVKSKYILYLRYFKVATLCLDDSFAHSWHSLNQLHEVVTLNAFQLTGVPWWSYFLMCFSQSVVLWQGRGGIPLQKLVKDQVHIMVRTPQISKEKWQSITLRHKGQSIWKMSRTLNVYSSAMMKLAIMRTATGKEDPELPLLQRISSLVTSLRNCSSNKCFTEFK